MKVNEAMAQTISSGTQSTTFTATSPDTYTLNAGETRTQSAGTGVQATVATGSTTIDIEGILNDVASGQRAIRANVPNGQVIVGTNGVVQSLNGDALQAQSATGRLDLTNAGQILSTSSAGQPTVGGTNPGTAFALNYNAAMGATNAPATDFTSGGVITNGSSGNTSAVIRSDSGDAIRLGSHETLVNYGTINGNGPVNDAATNNSFNTTGNTSVAQTYDISRGVRINQSGATSDRIDNYGTITGSQHGVDVGQTNVTGVVVNNAAGGQIIGRNGSGIGSDTTGAAPGTVTVTNSGLIRGAYAPGYDRAGYRTVDGDGDGVDVDGGATVTNKLGGVIEGAGAGGFDSNGRLNNSEGISVGGGSVTNDGTIRGAAYGIVVNNDSNADGSRSGVSATTITNGASGQIVGQGGYAIRLENKTGGAADNDSLVNAGTITGNGTIPAGTVNLQNGMPDPGTIGTLDGVTYTTANAGSARFIQGDGSAIQTGEGGDTLSNYGTITGNTGRALNLEGGNDTLNLYTGSTVSGSIDGGAGTDTLNLRLDDRPTTATSGSGSLGANSGVTTGTIGNVVNVEALSVQGGSWTISDAQTYTSGVSIAKGAALTVGASGSLSGAVSNAGTLTFAHAGDLAVASSVSGEGSVAQAGTGALTLSGVNTYTGGTSIAAGSVLGLASAASAGTGAISFGTISGTATARLAVQIAAQPENGGTFGNTLTGFGAGSQLDLAGVSNGSVSYDNLSTTLTVTGLRTGSAAPVVQSYRLSNVGSSNFQAQDDGSGGTLITVCYANGTRIRTVRGDIAVEKLAVGDLAVTASGASRPIRWIGSRIVECRNLPDPAVVMPVRIRAGALSESKPARDLVVSPGHAIAVDVLGEVLIPAIALVNGATIVQEDVDSVTYWHVELDSHDLLIAEGQAAESYLDMGNRSFFFEGGVISIGATPDGAAARTHADYCRPFVDGGVLIDAVRARSQARAETLGWRLAEPEAWADVHLEVDGAILQPRIRGLTASFVLPAEARDVCLVCPTSIPSRAGLGPDPRMLGLNLSSLSLADSFGAKTVCLDDPLLCVGFHLIEDGHRWTADRARLPATLLRGLEGDVFLRLDLAGPRVPRWVAPEGATVSVEAPRDDTCLRLVAA